MDPSRFDRLSRALAAATTRRAALAALGGWLLSSVVSTVETDAKEGRRKRRRSRRDGGDARDVQDRGRGHRDSGVNAAKKKKRKNKNGNKPKRCPNGKTRCGPKCVDTSSDASNCGRCGTACAPDQRCQGGHCTCNGEQCTGCYDGGACRAGDQDDLCGADGAVCKVCNGGSICQNGACLCPDGLHLCAGACVNWQTDSLHCGQCVLACAQGEICFAGFCGVTCGEGGFCSTAGDQPDCCGETCTSTETDSGHCGECGHACDSQIANRCAGGVCKCGSGGACAPDQHCQDGQCTCDGELCDGCCAGDTCQDGTDDRGCGTNGEVCQVCDGGRSCQDGSCVCPDGKHFCAGNCVDRLTNENHCGACGRACEAGEVCRFGLCGVTCGAGGFCSSTSFEPVCCGGTCVSTASSSRHCGECGNDCSTQLTNFCIEGTCRCGFTGAPCGEGQTCCFGGDYGVGGTGICLSTSTDMDHCGICDLACGPGANRCVQGDCRCGDGAECGEPLTCCGNQACFDLRHDQNNCGACGNVCQGGSQCNNGVCDCGSDGSCPTGQSCCGATGCLDLQTDENNCGFCGAACEDGQTCCNGRCKDLRSDSENCGACGSVCPGRGSTTSVECSQSGCSFSCKGENYDLNNDMNDGCEALDEQTNHWIGTATDLGSQSCHDAAVGSFSGAIFVDSRPHHPLSTGFDAFTNAAPLWYTVKTTFGACTNDPRVTLVMEGGTSGCYTLKLEGAQSPPMEATVIDGLAVISTDFGYYRDGDRLYFSVFRTCPPPSIPEVAFFEAQFHL